MNNTLHDVDTNILESLDFEPVCQIVYGWKMDEALVKCGPAKATHLVTFSSPIANGTTKLICPGCLRIMEFDSRVMITKLMPLP